MVEKSPQKKKNTQHEIYSILRLRGWNVVQEHRLCSDRRWKADIALVDAKVMLEYEGGVYTGGRHTRPSGFISDIEKYQRAFELGWIVVRAALPHAKSGEAIRWFENACKSRGFIPSQEPLSIECKESNKKGGRVRRNPVCRLPIRGIKCVESFKDDKQKPKARKGA
jgi:hypothetical protein